MKRLSIAFLLACTLFYAYPVKAQQNVVKMNFLSLIVKTFNVSYERVIDENNSFQLGVFYTGAKIGDTKLTGFGITPEYRFYLSETEAPNGVYVAPYLRYNNLELKDELSTSEATLSSIGGRPHYRETLDIQGKSFFRFIYWTFICISFDKSKIRYHYL